MRLLDRQVARELVAPFMAGVLVFIGVILVNTIVNNGPALFALNPPWRVVLRWLALRVPIILTYALPVGCMLATSLVVIRQGRDSEITAWRMGGVAVRRIFGPFYLAGLAVSALAIINNEFVAPRYSTRANEVLIEQILQGPGAGVKTDMPFRSGEETVAHVGRVDLQREEMYFVLVYRLREGRPIEAICAQRAVRQGGRWKLLNGQHNWFDTDGRLSRSERFDEAPVTFAANIAELWEDQDEPEQATAAELIRRMRLYQSVGDKVNALRMSYFLNAKFSIPLTCLVFTLLAAPLSLRFAGRGWHPMAGVLVTIGVVFFCNGTINWAKAIALSGPAPWIPPVPAAWLHVVVFGGLAAVLARQVER